MGYLKHDYLTMTKIPLDISSSLFEKALRQWDLGPLLQGVLMERIEPCWADRMHSAPFNPYSQYCIAEGSSVIWVVNTLTSEAYDAITKPLLYSTNLRIRKLDLSVSCGTPQQSRLSRCDLADVIHGSDARTFTLKFVSPAAFKSGGAYQTIPSMRLVYQNLLMHYGQVFNADHESDPETVDYLSSHTRVVRYRLHSQTFSLSGKKIPSFMGFMTVSVGGPKTLRGLAHMLFRFGGFAGVGIKTSMGMGGFLVE